MSEATFKKKTQSKYNNNSVSQGPQGFSINGTRRSQGWVGQELRSRTLVRTLNRAGANRGHGGCCGKYPRPFVNPSEILSTEDANVVKSPVLNTPGMLRERFAWVRRPAPFTSVKPDDNHGVGDQGSYLQYLNQYTISSIEQNCPYVLSKSNVNENPINSLVVDPSLKYFYTFQPENLSGNLLQNQGISQAYDLTIDSGVVDGNFDGSPIGGTISSSISLTSAGYSVGCWFKQTTLSNAFLFSFNSDESNNKTLAFNIFIVGTPPTPTFYIRDTINNTIPGINGSNNPIFSNVVLNRWYHVVYVNKGTTWDIYIDGVFYVSLSGKTPADGAVKGSNFMGKFFTLTTNVYKGELDGFFIYQGQLTAAQISEIYSKGQQPTQTNYYYTIPIQPKTYSYACPRRLFLNTNYNQPNICPYGNKSIPSNLGAVDSGFYLLDYKSGCSSIDASNNFGVSRNSCAQCPILASTIY